MTTKDFPSITPNPNARKELREFYAKKANELNNSSEECLNALNEIRLIDLEDQLKELIDIISIHEIESCQCDGKEETHCNCLRASVLKAKKLLGE